MSNIQKLSIRLLKEGALPTSVIREGVDLQEYTLIPNSYVAYGNLGENTPKWVDFLNLSHNKDVMNKSTYSLLFIKTEDRWFVVSFGLGHVKLNLDECEYNFGLKVVLNTVDSEQLRSADVRTPDENTLSKRAQTSRGSDQAAFTIDVERDLLRGIAGKPKNKDFASYIAGSDGLVIHKKVKISDLANVCEDVYRAYINDDYKNDFSWIDYIRHLRDSQLIHQLEQKLAESITLLLQRKDALGIYLAYPTIYNPENSSYISYKGFKNDKLYPDLELNDYIETLLDANITNYDVSFLSKHTVNETDEYRQNNGGKWKIYDCLVFEIIFEKNHYILSCGNWYKIDQTLAEEVNNFFNNSISYNLPEAGIDENEEAYNLRISQSSHCDEMICLDRQLISPSGSKNPIEVCDFLKKDKSFIHIKDKTTSSRLSHLFNQGTVSARVMLMDPAARDKILEKIQDIQAKTGQTGFEEIIPSSRSEFKRSDFTVVYGVLTSQERPTLPFFSLISFKQAAHELQLLGYKYAFSWITKNVSDSRVINKKSKPRKKKQQQT